MQHSFKYKDAYIHVTTSNGSEVVEVQIAYKLYLVKSVHAAKLFITRRGKT